MSTYNICFYGEIRKIIPVLSPVTQNTCNKSSVYRHRADVTDCGFISESVLVSTYPAVLHT